jgi:hypothetical protein
MSAGPIRFSEEEVQIVLNNFRGQLVEFPINYLGIPFSVGKLPNAVLLLLIDKGCLMHHSGRLVLVKTTLSAMLSTWLRKAFEKVMKEFLWSGSDEVQGGKCLVAWSRV